MKRDWIKLESSLSSLTVKNEENSFEAMYKGVYFSTYTKATEEWLAQTEQQSRLGNSGPLVLSQCMSVGRKCSGMQATCLEARVCRRTWRRARISEGPHRGGGEAHYPTYTWRDPATRNRCAGNSGKTMTDKFTINVATSLVDNKLLANESLFVIFRIIHHMQRYVALNHGCKRGETQTQTMFAAISTYLTGFNTPRFQSSTMTHFWRKH
jgi:hypothetical protein